jgi:CcmD family protein
MRRKWITTFLVALTLALTVLGPAVAPLAAQQQPQSGQGEFVPVKDLPHQEQLPAAPLVMGAYAFVWVVLLVYVWSLWRRVGALQRELTDLRKRTAARK